MLTLIRPLFSYIMSMPQPYFDFIGWSLQTTPVFSSHVKTVPNFGKQVTSCWTEVSQILCMESGNFVQTVLPHLLLRWDNIHSLIHSFIHVLWPPHNNGSSGHTGSHRVSHFSITSCQAQDSQYAHRASTRESVTRAMNVPFPSIQLRS